MPVKVGAALLLLLLARAAATLLYVYIYTHLCSVLYSVEKEATRRDVGCTPLWRYYRTLVTL